MNLSFQKVTKENLRAVAKLSDTLTEEQKRNVANNAFSIAEAHYNKDIVWFRAIYLETTPVGFIMLDTVCKENDDNSAYLWRFMVAKDYQQKGIGKWALDQVVKMLQKKNKAILYTSVVMERNQPYDFYIQYGFEDTLEDEGDERVLKLDLAKMVI